MAIRIELPQVVFPRLRLHWHVTRTHFARQYRVLQQRAERAQAVSRAGWERASTRLFAPFDLRVRDCKRQLARLEPFEAGFDALVDLLCWSAKDGVQVDMEARYAELRGCAHAQYRPLRRHLRTYCVTPESPSNPDPFESLLAVDNVNQAINAMNSIEYLMQARSALEAYRAALESRLRRSF